MFCPKCGTNVNEGSRFCPVCGNDMAAVPVQTPAPVAEPAAAPMVEPMAAPMAEPMAAPKKKKGLMIAIISIASVLVVAAIVVCVYLFVIKPNQEAASNNDVNECEECGDEFEGKGDLCEDCKEKAKNSEKPEDEEPAEAKKCENCGEEFEGTGLFCFDCADGVENKWCFKCGETRLDEGNLAVIDSDNYGYCEDCDTGNYCENCGAPVEFGEDYCEWCGGDDGGYDYGYDDYYDYDYDYDDYYDYDYDYDYYDYY